MFISMSFLTEVILDALDAFKHLALWLIPEILIFDLSQFGQILVKSETDVG